MSDTEEFRAVTRLIVAVATIIQEMGAEGAISGVLYAALNSKGCSLDQYYTIIGILKQQGLVREQFNVLYWIGPEPKKEQNNGQG